MSWSDGVYSIDYESWLKKSAWTPEEAVSLLFSLEPSGLEGKYKWINQLPEMSPVLVVPYNTLGNSGFSSTVSEVAHLCRFRTEHLCEKAPIKPYEWIQYFTDEGILSEDKLAFEDKLNASLKKYSVSFAEYLREAGIVSKPGEESKIRYYYGEWAKSEMWSFAVVVALICYLKLYLPGLRLLPSVLYDNDEDTLPPNYYISDLTNKLKTSIANKAISCTEVDCQSHIERRFKQEDIIIWARKNGYKFPELLLEELNKAQPDLLKKFGLKPKASNNPNIAPEKRCTDWLKSLTAGKKEHGKVRYKEEAMRLFSPLGDRAFNRAWEKATQGTSWGEAGRIPKKAKN